MKETSYLHHLKFDKSLYSSFIARYLSNPRLLILVLIAIIGLGSFSFASLPRRTAPELKIPLVIISDVLPGANPEDVESLITIPLEDSISGVENVSKVTSSSRENVSVIQIEFNTGVDPEKARTDTQSAIDQAQLPTDAQTPKVQTIDFENSPVWTFALVGKGDVASLNRYSKILQKNLEDLSSIKDVSTGGLEDKEISVVIDQSKLATYGLSPIQLSNLVKSSLSSYPAGTVRTDTSSFALSIDPATKSINDIRNLQLDNKGTSIPLSSVATITERSKPNQNPSFIASHTQAPERSVTFNVYKSKTTNIDKAVHDAEKEVEESLSSYEGQFSVRTISNSGEDITTQFQDLTRDFIITIILVFLVLFVFLGARQAIVSLFAVPLTFLISFAVMSSSGISLNFISMFSLLLALGLLVDDTIVVISAMTSYYRSGKFTPLETGLLVWKDFITPILTTTLTTVFAFLPILISTGIIGEFIKSIPIVVSSTLIASFGVAMLITLPLMIILLKPRVAGRVVVLLKVLFVIFLIGVFISILPKNILIIPALLTLGLFLFVTAHIRRALLTKTKAVVIKQKRVNQVVKNAPHFLENGLISFHKISDSYHRVIIHILTTKENRRKAMAMVILFSIFSYLLVPFGFVKNEFFPKSDATFISLNVQLPPGTNTETSQKEALVLLDQLRTTRNVDYVTADLGQSTSAFGGAEGSEANNILFSIVLPEKTKRDQTSIEIGEILRKKYAGYTKGKVTLSESSGGPPAGADLQINLFGQQLTTLDGYADKVVSYLKAQKGANDITKSIIPGTSKIVFIPDQEQLVANNVSRDQLGLTLRTFASGFTLDTAKLANTDSETSDKQDITLRSSNKLQSVSDISSISVTNANGSVIPLSSLGRLTLKSNPTLITREDGQRTISVTATVAKGYTTTELNSTLEKFADSELGLSQGYNWKTGGVNEENQKSVNSILQAMLISFLLIIVTMVIQFGSFRKAVIVMLVIPLSISGVFIIFALTQTPLSFPALIGVLALFGIVVKNSILIVDKIAANERIGMEFVDGIVDGASSRLEPIALTSLAAIMGLIPITISDPLWRGLGGAIIAGLTFSGTIMLFFIPVVYYTWFSSKAPSKKSAK